MSLFIDPVWVSWVNDAARKVHGMRGPGVINKPGALSVGAAPRITTTRPDSSDGLPSPQYEGDILMAIAPNTIGFALGYAVNVIPSF